MDITVGRAELADAVSWAARHLPARPPAPVLAGMRLQAGDELTVSVFDYEVSAEATTPIASGYNAPGNHRTRRSDASTPIRP